CATCGSLTPAPLRATERCGGTRGRTACSESWAVKFARLARLDLGVSHPRQCGREKAERAEAGEHPDIVGSTPASLVEGRPERAIVAAGLECGGLEPVVARKVEACRDDDGEQLQAQG